MGSFSAPPARVLKYDPNKHFWQRKITVLVEAPH